MRIGVVSNLPATVSALRCIVDLVPAHQITWVAISGVEAGSLCEGNRPDLLLMDVMLSDMDCVGATRQIMENTPCPILILTESMQNDTARIFEAMGHGALDVIDTPLNGPDDLRTRAAPLLTKISMVDRLTGHGADRRGARRETIPVSLPPLVAIGASAGGPAALGILLSALPKNFPAAVIIVQHVDERFSLGMAEWLDRHSTLPVRVAAEDDRPTQGTVLLAGTGDHLTFKTPYKLGYTPEPQDYVYRPSVNVCFWSICKHWHGDAVGVLLTGMGSDGALGLKALRDKGHYTIAQDQASSAVYGMPKAAAASNAAVDILPLERIAPKLVEIFSSRKMKTQEV